MKLKQLLCGVRVAYMNADPDAEVKDVVNHSDKALKGTVFAALCGEREDGYGYIKNAIKNGCRLILCDRMPYLPCGCIVTENCHEAYARMCAALCGDPQLKLHTYAVTGNTGRKIKIQERNKPCHKSGRAVMTAKNGDFILFGKRDNLRERVKSSRNDDCRRLLGNKRLKR